MIQCFISILWRSIKDLSGLLIIVYFVLISIFVFFRRSVNEHIIELLSILIVLLRGYHFTLIGLVVATSGYHFTLLGTGTVVATSGYHITLLGTGTVVATSGYHFTLIGLVVATSGYHFTLNGYRSSH